MSVPPKKFQPPGFEILYDDRDVIVGNKEPGLLTVAAKWNKDYTVEAALNHFVRKGSRHSKKIVYVVHRLDQDTSGLLVFAKCEEAQIFLKNDWKNTEKIYYALAHGIFEEKTGTISSHLSEDEDYKVHSSKDDKGKLSHTEYKVVAENEKFSLVRINLLTGRKNQIRVHLADVGHPVVGDTKYGKPTSGYRNLMLHAASLSFDHPHSRKRMSFSVRPPPYFDRVLKYAYP